MPHYDYKCEKCGNIFEEFQTITEKHVEKCPKCGGNVKRLIGGGGGIIFKGTGFYKTDYKKTESSCAAKSETSPKCASCPAVKSGN
jgi:putative FmdB family regulatory protein